jgi:hypothetical protein
VFVFNGGYLLQPQRRNKSSQTIGRPQINDH